MANDSYRILELRWEGKSANPPPGGFFVSPKPPDPMSRTKTTEAGTTMTGIWALASLWLGLALIASLLSIWLQVSTALSEIIVGSAYHRRGRRRRDARHRRDLGQGAVRHRRHCAHVPCRRRAGPDRLSTKVEG